MTCSNCVGSVQKALEGVNGQIAKMSAGLKSGEIDNCGHKQNSRTHGWGPQR